MNMRTTSVFTLLITLYSISVISSQIDGEITPIAERLVTRPSRWILLEETDPHHRISYKILLKQRNLDILDKVFWEVSDPQHPNYGNFLTTEEVKSLISSDPKSKALVYKWIIESGISPSGVGIFSDYIQVTSTIREASNLFTTSFHWYKSTKTGNYKIRILGPAHIPSHLEPHIDFVAGISELIENAYVDPKQHDAVDNLITPAVLKNYYGIPNGTVSTNAKNRQGIAAFTDYFSLGAFEAFNSYFGITAAVNVTREGPDCFPDLCDQYESDLDVQYITSIGAGVPTLFLTQGDGDWVLEWAMNLSSRTDAPLVNSISYGWSELDHCDVTESCQTYGYDSQQYVTRVNTEFQALGAKGITILVSDGDDGAPSLYASSGNCPMDPSLYCPSGGCTHTTSACTEVIFTLTNNNTQCFYPMGITSDICNDMFEDPNLSPAFDNFTAANSNCAPNIETDVYGNPHFYSSCTCDKLVAQTSFGYRIEGYSFDQSNGPVFSADYPTSSPYVTSVGATQFTWNGQSVASEISASILTQAIITTGGGFSTFQAQGSYQAAAVTAWVQNGGSNLPPTFAYNPKMRGYPDISFNGHNYLIYASNNTDDLDECPCGSLAVDGTSCSSPALAGLLSLVNDKLLNAGKTQLGFLNPLLYQMAAANPNAFHDITSGTNQCNRAYCCSYGYKATTGWDPVTGLGSPIFSQFQQYVLELKGIDDN